jgi:hypothetical protein
MHPKRPAHKHSLILISTGAPAQSSAGRSRPNGQPPLWVRCVRTEIRARCVDSTKPRDRSRRCSCSSARPSCAHASASGAAHWDSHSSRSAVSSRGGPGLAGRSARTGPARCPGPRLRGGPRKHPLRSVSILGRRVPGHRPVATRFGSTPKVVWRALPDLHWDAGESVKARDAAAFWRGRRAYSGTGAERARHSGQDSGGLPLNSERSAERGRGRPGGAGTPGNRPGTGVGGDGRTDDCL